MSLAMTFDVVVVVVGETASAASATKIRKKNRKLKYVYSCSY